VIVITLASNWHLPCFIVEQIDQRISGGTRNNNSQIDEEEREGGDRRQTECNQMVCNEDEYKMR
jgi:hypothetical protein